MRLLTNEVVLLKAHVVGNEASISYLFAPEHHLLYQFGSAFDFRLPLFIRVMLLKHGMYEIFNLEISEDLQCSLRNRIPLCIEHFDNGPAFVEIGDCRFQFVQVSQILLIQMNLEVLPVEEILMSR